MTHVFLVTLVLDIDLDTDAAGEAAAALLAQDAVVTVRITDGAASVVRLDVDAAEERDAARAARELVTSIARRLHCAISIRSAHAVPDRDRAGIDGHPHDQM